VTTNEYNYNEEQCKKNINIRAKNTNNISTTILKPDLANVYTIWPKLLLKQSTWLFHSCWGLRSSSDWTPTHCCSITQNGYNT